MWGIRLTVFDRSPFRNSGNGGVALLRWQKVDQYLYLISRGPNLNLTGKWRIRAEPGRMACEGSMLAMASN